VWLIASPPVAISVEKSHRLAIDCLTQGSPIRPRKGIAIPGHLTNSGHYGKQRDEVRHEDRKSNRRFRDDA
jgi:hypothetical protein